MSRRSSTVQVLRVVVGFLMVLIGLAFIFVSCTDIIEIGGTGVARLILFTVGSFTALIGFVGAFDS